MNQSNTEQFSNRWGIILASLGMAIGAGNLWRFPRLAGQYGGSFILLWIFFLLVWSIPLLLVEFSIGKKFKKGVISSYAALAGKKYTFLGFFITICTLGIAFYYAVINVWALRYLMISIESLFSSFSLKEKLIINPQYLESYWQNISNGSLLSVAIHLIVILLATYVLIKGVKQGLERVNKILIPSLFILLIIITFISLNMPGGFKGLEYMFSINIDYFFNPTIWIEALSQSAWSTGAGWGLMMTISAYTRKNEDVALNTLVGAFGNNTASLLAGIAILPAVFALSVSDAEAIGYLQSGNQALTFTIIPKLFTYVQGGSILSVIFFLALFLAAFSSLLPMIELFIKNSMDLGFSRKKVAFGVVICFVFFGFFSVYNLDFFSNQDFVWGIGLVLTGLFILFAVVKYGITKFKKEFIDKDSDFILPVKYFTICIPINLIMGMFLIYWWMSQGYSENPWFDEFGYWNVMDVYSNASIITQWGITLIIGFVLNNYLYKKFVKNA